MQLRLSIKTVNELEKRKKEFIFYLLLVFEDICTKVFLKENEDISRQEDKNRHLAPFFLLIKNN